MISLQCTFVKTMNLSNTNCHCQLQRSLKLITQNQNWKCGGCMVLPGLVYGMSGSSRIQNSRISSGSRRRPSLPWIENGWSCHLRRNRATFLTARNIVLIRRVLKILFLYFHNNCSVCEFVCDDYKLRVNFHWSKSNFIVVMNYECICLLPWRTRKFKTLFNLDVCECECQFGKQVLFSAPKKWRFMCLQSALSPQSACSYKFQGTSL